MNGWVLPNTYTTELNAVIRNLSKYRQDAEISSQGGVENTPQPLVPPGAQIEAHQARRAVMANIAKLQILLDEPADFLHKLAKQVSHSFSYLTDRRWRLSPWIPLPPEPTSRLYKLARRVPSARLYTSWGPRPFQRCRGACWSARNATRSNHAHGCHCWLSS